MIQLSLECWVAANMHKILIEKDLHHALGSHGQHTGYGVLVVNGENERGTLAERFRKAFWEDAWESKHSDCEMQAEAGQDEGDIPIHHLFVKY